MHVVIAMFSTFLHFIQTDKCGHSGMAHAPPHLEIAKPVLLGTSYTPYVNVIHTTLTSYYQATVIDMRMDNLWNFSVESFRILRIVDFQHTAL